MTYELWLTQSCRLWRRDWREPSVLYTRRQINLYRMFFADFSVNSQPILMKFCKDYFLVTRRLPWNFHKKISCSSKVKPFEITTSLYNPIKLVKLKFVFSPELHYMPDGLTF